MNESPRHGIDGLRGSLAGTLARLGHHTKARSLVSAITEPETRAHSLNHLATLSEGDRYTDLVAERLTTNKWLEALPAVAHLARMQFNPSATLKRPNIIRHTIKFDVRDISSRRQRPRSSQYATIGAIFTDRWN